MNIRNYLSYCLGICLLLMACQPKETPQESTETDLTSIEAELTCTALGEDENGVPGSLVALVLNGTKHDLDTIAACESIGAADFGRYDIPTEAVSACGGWWAGAGDYFYVMVEGNVCTVMQGWQDEQQEDEGFHYEQVRRLVVSEK